MFQRKKKEVSESKEMDLEKGEKHYMRDQELDVVVHNIYRTYDFHDSSPMYSHRSNVYRYKVNQGSLQFLIR